MWYLHRQLDVPCDVTMSHWCNCESVISLLLCLIVVQCILMLAKHLITMWLLPTQYLPKEELYTPPLNIRILDKRSFGRMPLVGTHVIKSLKDFHVEPVLSAVQRAAVQGGKKGGERRLLA